MIYNILYERGIYKLNNNETKDAEIEKDSIPNSEEKIDNEETTKNEPQNEKDSSDQQSIEVEKLKKELQSKTDILLRTAAEYENYRKRTEREKAYIYSDATASAISAILPIADSIERAMQSLGDTNEEYKKGLELIKNQLEDSFKTLGVESFGEKGDKFNPDIHNAISHIENDELEENVISEIFQKGYKISDKIVRYAMVQAAN